MSDWIGLAQAELVKLPGPHVAKKQATIIELVAARLSPEMVEEDVWSKEDTCSRTTYHTKWKKNAVFAGVLAAVTDIAMTWQSGSSLRHLQERQEAWQKQAYEMALKMIEKAGLMIDFPLVRTTMEDDLVTVEPARWSMDSIPRLVTAADKLARLSLDMATDKSISELVGDEERPVVHKFDLSDLPMDVLHGLATKEGPE